MIPSYLLHSIANNLYGHAMSQLLPIGEFKWVPETSNDDDPHTMQETQLFTDVNAVLNLPDDSDTGYIFEVDLHYPTEIHDAHNDFPFCAEKQTLPSDAFEIICKRANERANNEGIVQKNKEGLKTMQIEGNKINKTNKIDKLLLTLNDKGNYVLHYRMLKLALQHGLKLKKVHRVLKYKQSLWLKPYISLNTEMRTKSQSDFEKSFYKLMNNAVYGKTMENLRSRVDIKLVNKWGGKNGARMLIAKPCFKKCRIFDEQLVAIEMGKTSMLMNKPIAVGMCVLDISKITMYGFLYNFLKPKYGDKVGVAYGDTDSFVLEIKTDDFYEDMRKNISLFDTSDYPWPNVYNIEHVNKKVPGLFKDELNGTVMTEFVGLRAKCYAVRTLDDKRLDEKMKKSKGVKQCILKRKITFDDYVDCIKRSREIKHKQNTIRSIKHNVYTIEQEKIVLSPFDDKRYIIMPNGIETLAWGHHRINAYEKAHQSNV